MYRACGLFASDRGENEAPARYRCGVLLVPRGSRIIHGSHDLRASALAASRRPTAPPNPSRFERRRCATIDDDANEPRLTEAAALDRAPGRLTIDLGALADNWRNLARRAAPGRCAAVVKANAYGIGLAEAAPALWAAGARVFFVAHLSEGVAARRLLPEATIYVLNGLESGANPRDYAEHGLAPVVGGEEELARWSTFAARRGRTSPCALHLDTGMNRLGFDSLPRLRAAMKTHGLTSGADLLMSHLVSSEVIDDPINAAQIERFEAARAAFPNLPASLANSSGMFLSTRPIDDMARPGYALYGGNPTPGRPNPMLAVVTLAIAIQQTRWIEAGMTCGYNGQWTAKRRTRLATLLAGYADGLPRGAGATDLKPGAEVAVGGRRCPLVGRVSMDLTIADVTDVPEDAARAGDRVEFFGPSVDLDEFAARSGTIGYQVLTSLGPRYFREHLREGRGSASTLNAPG
jgi:alanine racemase